MISAEVKSSWTELHEKGSPLTYTSDKFRAGRFIFCTVFPCQIWMGLHEIYWFAYWPSVRSKWLDIGRVFFTFSGTETKSRSKKKKRTRFISSYLDRTSLVKRVYVLLAWTLKDSLHGKIFRFDNEFREPRGKANCFCSKIDLWGLFNFFYVYFARYHHGKSQAGEGGLILHAQVSNQTTGFSWSCPRALLAIW